MFILLLCRHQLYLTCRLQVFVKKIYLSMISFLVMLSILSPCLSMSQVPAMYQVTSGRTPYIPNHFNSSPLVQEQHFLTSPHYPRLTGVYTRLEEEVMNAPVYQKVDLITGKDGAAYLCKRKGGNYFLLHYTLI
jgi:hypothetical protein